MSLSQEFVSVKFSNGKSTEVPLPNDFCDISDTEAGGDMLEQYKKAMGNDYIKKIALNCSSDSGMPYMTVYLDTEFLPSKYTQEKYNKMISKNLNRKFLKDISKSLEKKLKDTDLGDQIKLSLMGNNQKPTLLWEDENVIVFAVLATYEKDGVKGSKQMITFHAVHLNNIINLNFYDTKLDETSEIFNYLEMYLAYFKKLKS